jgi:nucleotide-binding universal stress UspA family protein
MKILLAVDGSGYTAKAAEYLATHFEWFHGTPELHVLHVKLPVPPGLALERAQALLGKDEVSRYYREESEAALAPAETILRAHKIPFHAEYRVGDVAREICAYATEQAVDLIVMGSHGHGALANLVMGSVATKVLAATPHIPVLIVR